MKFDQWIWRRRFLKRQQCIFTIISPVKMVQWFWRRKWKCEKFIGRQMNKQTKGNQKSSTGLSFIWSSLSMYFRYFLIISPWKGVWPFIWTNLNPHHPRMLCAKFGWNWPCCSWEEDENVKSLQTDGQTDRQTDRRTDDGQQAIRKSQLSFQLRWAKNCMLYKHCNYNVSKRLL